MGQLGERIQLLRKSAKLSQEELSKIIGVSRAQLNRYENRDVQPTANVLKFIADELNTTTDFLISGTAEEKAKAALKDSEVLKHFKDVDELPETDKNALLRVISAFIRDTKTRQAYAS